MEQITHSLRSIEGLDQLKERLRGSPKRLFIICCIQASVLVIGIFVGHGGAECELFVIGSGQVQINCGVCRTMGGLRWRDFMLLGGGLSVIAIGMFAALFNHQRACKLYGMVMLVYAFIIGLTSILTGLQAPVLSSAATAVSDTACQKIAFMMVDNVRYHAVLYGLNCILDCLGATFAIYSKQFFEYQEVQARNRRAQEATNDML